MKSQMIWITALAFCVAACGDREPAADPDTAAATEEPAAETALPEHQHEADEEFVKHMHLHADQLDKLMFALADGDLWGAMTPAYWLSRHETMSGIPDEWQQYVRGMRASAFAVESATDLETARAAAEEITMHCQGCHRAAGVLEEE